MAGDLVSDETLSKVREWQDSDDPRPLHEFLGYTWEQYEEHLWKEAPMRVSAAIERLRRIQATEGDVELLLYDKPADAVGEEFDIKYEKSMNAAVVSFDPTPGVAGLDEEGSNE